MGSQEETLPEDFGLIVKRVLNAVIDKDLKGNTTEMARRAGLRQSTVRGVKNSGRASLQTINALCRSRYFVNGLIRDLAGEQTDDPSWQRVASDLRKIMSLRQAWDIIDFLGQVVRFGDLEDGIRHLRDAAETAKAGHKKGRTHPLVGISEEKLEKPGT